MRKLIQPGPKWTIEIRDSSKTLLKLCLKGEDKKLLRSIYRSVEGKDFLTTLSLFVHHLNIYIDNEEKVKKFENN